MKSSETKVEMLDKSIKVGNFALGVILYIPSVVVRLVMKMPRVLFDCFSLAVIAAITITAYLLLNIISCGEIIPTKVMLEKINSFFGKLKDKSVSSIGNSFKDSFKFVTLDKSKA